MSIINEVEILLPPNVFTLLVSLLISSMYAKVNKYVASQGGVHSTVKLNTMCDKKKYIFT